MGEGRDPLAHQGSGELIESAHPEGWGEAVTLGDGLALLARAAEVATHDVLVVLARPTPDSGEVAQPAREVGPHGLPRRGPQRTGIARHLMVALPLLGLASFGEGLAEFPRLPIVGLVADTHQPTATR